MSMINDFFDNKILFTAVFTLVFAQFLKFVITRIVDGKWDITTVITTGGMPSSHSALVVSLAMITGLVNGFNNIYFAMSCVLAIVVVHDSMGIRLEAGKHATAINKMKKQLDELQANKSKQEDEKEKNQELKELLGHEPIEAIAGSVLGLIIAVLCYLIFF